MKSPTTDPTAIYRYRDSLAAVDALAVAIVHLDLFTALAHEPADLDGICRRFSLHHRPADVLCTLLAANGLVRRDPAGRLHVTDTAREFLVAGGPHDARGYYASMADKPGVSDVLAVLRTGRPAHWPGDDAAADWHAAMRTEAFAESFTAAMDCRGRVLAPALADAIAGHAVHRLLDVGGGSGVYAIAIAESRPDVRATVLEAAPVDAIARRTIAAAGLGDRVGVATADMFLSKWPSDHDTHLFSNVLHDWDEPDCRRLLALSAAALPAGGRILVHDMFLDDDKAGPLWAAEYSTLLSTVTQGRLYSAAEIAGWLVPLGLRIVSRHATALGRGVLVADRGGPVAG
jgi:predicted O-methyltransferase YrrM